MKWHRAVSSSITAFDHIFFRAYVISLVFLNNAGLCMGLLKWSQFHNHSGTLIIRTNVRGGLDNRKVH